MGRSLKSGGQSLATHKSEMSVGNKKSSKNGIFSFKREGFPFHVISFLFATSSLLS